MRRYIRHPSDVPIEFSIAGAEAREALKDVSGGGLCFRAHLRIPPGADIHLVIPVRAPPFEADGVVAWCREAGREYEVGVRFYGESSGFSLRMVEQICYIEQYRRDILQHEGRHLSGEQAAAEWIALYAERFPV
jgi:hypothetical protein